MQSLQKLIDKLKSCENTKFPTLKVTQGNFEGDQIIEQNLLCSVFKNSTLKNVEFKTTQLGLSSFEDCKFQDCKFQDCDLNDTTFFDCNFQNCQFIDSQITESFFKTVSFINCKFLESNLVQTRFDSCKFINTSIAIGTNYQIYVYSVIIIDSTIGNSEKSITLNGKFELTDFLLPSNKINDFLS